MRPFFERPVSPRRPRCPSTITTSSTSSPRDTPSISSSRATSFSIDEEEYFSTVEDWIQGQEEIFPTQDCSCPGGYVCNICFPRPPQILKSFTFEDLQQATMGFHRDRLIGEELLCCVYKGWINEETLTASGTESGMVVAIKKYRPQSFKGPGEWLNERVSMTAQFNHLNIVTLIGYCSLSDEHQLLVYEYMPNKSLDRHLFTRGGHVLSWEVRIKIAVGIAKALSFLHDSRIQVIHRNVKSAHILLDSEFNAKLSGFALAMVGHNDDDDVPVVGTYGYAAPEYVATGFISAKADVYGFGVVLLEILSGLRFYDRDRPIKMRDLVGWAKPFLCDKKKLIRLMDSKLEGHYSPKEALYVAMITFKCLSKDPKDRPSMPEILTALEQIHNIK